MHYIKLDMNVITQVKIAFILTILLVTCILNRATIPPDKWFLQETVNAVHTYRSVLAALALCWIITVQGLSGLLY